MMTLKSELRPIGTVFDSEIFYPSAHTTENTASIHTWEVTAHDDCEWHGKVMKLERVNTIDVRRSKPRTHIPIVNGVLMVDWEMSVRLGFEPPPEFGK